MKVEQAIFTSVANSRIRGYQLAGRSPGVTDLYAQQLMHWGPTGGAMVSAAPEFASLNYFPLQGERLAITRTVHGGPEYSSRGQLQTFTRILLLENRQLAGYDNDPLAAILTARLLGLLRFTTNFSDRMPTVDLPHQPPVGLSTRTVTAPSRPRLKKLGELLRSEDRIAIQGEQDPEATLHHLLRQTPVEERATLSFTTGLAPSSLRPFKLHFLPEDADASFHGLKLVL